MGDESLTDEQIADAQQTANWYLAGYTIVAILMLIAFIRHGYCCWQDLFTQERKSVSYRNRKPVITSGYKVIQLLTVIAKFLFTLSTIFGIIAAFQTTDEGCDGVVTALICFLQAAKTTMYIVFLARLYNIYEQSPYRYPLKCIALFAVILPCYGLAIVLTTIFVNTSHVYIGDGKRLPNYCGPGQAFEYYIVCSTFVFQDIVAAFGFYWAFMIPLRKTVKAIKNRDASATHKILYTARKVAVLVSVAVGSTLLFMTLTAFVSAGFSIPDAYVNQLCMMFMTAYYPDNIYYERFCKPCIKCSYFVGCGDGRWAAYNDADPKAIKLAEAMEAGKKKSGNNEEESETNVSMKVSTDTKSQLRVVGQRLAVSYNYIPIQEELQKVPDISQEDQKQEEQDENQGNQNITNTPSDTP